MPVWPEKKPESRLSQFLPKNIIKKNYKKNKNYNSFLIFKKMV